MRKGLNVGPTQDNVDVTYVIHAGFFSFKPLHPVISSVCRSVPTVYMKRDVTTEARSSTRDATTPGTPLHAVLSCSGVYPALQAQLVAQFVLATQSVTAEQAAPTLTLHFRDSQVSIVPQSAAAVQLAPGLAEASFGSILISPMIARMM